MAFKQSVENSNSDAVLLEECSLELCSRVDWTKLKALRTLYGSKALELRYLQTCAHLRSRQPLAEQQTHKEHKFLRNLRRHTKLRLLPAFWIGRSCFDIFIPAVRGGGQNKMRGMVIEIDGPVHQIEGKMKKDEMRGEMLKQFGIAHVGIDNATLDGELPRTLIAELKTFKRLDYRARQRLIGNIQAWTVFVNEKYLPGGHCGTR